jgi:hypothetical protein
MGLPEKRREADEIVEPLFAGLSGAEEQPGRAPEEDEAGEEKLDPWTHSRAALSPPSLPPANLDAEPSLAPLLLKAFVLLIVLVAFAGFVYFAFGV